MKASNVGFNWVFDVAFPKQMSKTICDLPWHNQSHVAKSKCYKQLFELSTHNIWILRFCNNLSLLTLLLVELIVLCEVT